MSPRSPTPRATSSTTNGDNLIRLGEVSAQQLRVLAKYAPEYPCLLKGIVNAAGPQAEAFRGFTLHIVLETLPNQPRGYNPRDLPRFGDTRGPSCGSLPNPPYSQANPVRTQPDFDDGVDEPTGKGTIAAYGFAGSADETAARRRCRAGAGVTADDVPDLGALLVGPMRARGGRPTSACCCSRPSARGAAGGAAMKLLDRKTAIDTVKLAVFMLVTTLLTSMLVVTIGNLSFGGTKEYRAEFVDATGVVKGDDVRIAGVKVGSVTEVEIVDRTVPWCPSRSRTTTPLSGATDAAIRYRNLVGQRYLSLTETIGDTGALDEGATIPVDRTQPALDLTVLFNGFKPLFQALSPEDLNKLSYEIDPGLPGRGRHPRGAARHTASVTQTLADRDEVIGDLIDNLNEVLVDHRRPRRAADRPDHPASAPSSAGSRTTARRSWLARRRSRTLSVETADLVAGHPRALRPRTSRSCATSPATSTATRPSSTGPCRCCRSSSRRSAAPRSTAPSSTSTSASSSGA